MEFIRCVNTVKIIHIMPIQHNDIDKKKMKKKKKTNY